MGANLVVWMLVVVSILYSGAAIGYVISDRVGMAIAFTGYIAANIGLILDALHRPV